MAPSADSRTLPDAERLLPACRCGRPARTGQDCAGAGQGFGLGCASSAVQAPISTSRKPTPAGSCGEIAQGEALAAHEVDQQVVEAFEADGLVLESERDGVGGEKRIGEAQHGEHAEGRAGGEVERGGDDVGAGAFGADQRAGHVEVVFGQQLVEVVAGDAAGDAREFFADQGGVAVADAGEARVDLAHAAAGADRVRRARSGGWRRRSCACRRRARCRAIRRCRRLCRPAGRERRNCCCRSCRRGCSGSGWRGRARR